MLLNLYILCIIESNFNSVCYNIHPMQKDIYNMYIVFINWKFTGFWLMVWTLGYAVYFWKVAPNLSWDVIIAEWTKMYP